jgi:type I restriction enzyme S subunit
MSEVLRPYPHLAESGLDWIGPIPSHWQVSRNGRLFSQRVDTGRPELPVLEVSLRTGVRVRDLEAGGRKQSMSDPAKYKVAARGDIAYNMMRMWQGAVGVAPVGGLVSPAYVVARPRPGVSTRYYAYLFRTEAYREEVNRRSRGIVADRNRLYWQDFKQLSSLQPPPEEQDRIADFLDAHGRVVGRLIRTKQRLIALLNEQKQAIIQRAVTRGLDPDVNLKASGVEWLEKVPEHWEIVRLNRVLRTIEQGWSPVAAEGELGADQWGVLALSAVKRGCFSDQERKPIASTVDVPAHLEVRPGDLLLTRSNTRQLVGDACVVQHTRPKLIFSDLIYRLRPDNRRLLPTFLMYQLLAPAGRVQIEADARGSSSTMVKISHGHIKRWLVALPTVSEQEAILERIACDLRGIEQVTSSAHREIAYIREYRSRLIADVVTGKLDVRHVSLPPTDGDAGESDQWPGNPEAPELEDVFAGDDLIASGAVADG